MNQIITLVLWLSLAGFAGYQVGLHKVNAFDVANALENAQVEIDIKFKEFDVLEGGTRGTFVYGDPDGRVHRYPVYYDKEGNTHFLPTDMPQYMKSAKAIMTLKKRLTLARASSR